MSEEFSFHEMPEGFRTEAIVTVEYPDGERLGEWLDAWRELRGAEGER